LIRALRLEYEYKHLLRALVHVTNFITLFYEDNTQRFFNVPDCSYSTIFVASLLYVYKYASLNDGDTF